MSYYSLDSLTNEDTFKSLINSLLLPHLYYHHYNLYHLQVDFNRFNHSNYGYVIAYLASDNKDIVFRKFTPKEEEPNPESISNPEIDFKSIMSPENYEEFKEQYILLTGHFPYENR